MIRRLPPSPQAAVLLLHGGRADALEAPPAVNLPAVRLRPFASSIMRATRNDQVLVGRVRYRHRGWNGVREDAVPDARQALRAVVDTAGDVPVVLVGHSMGARAALRLAGEAQIKGVVALAPWCPPGEPLAEVGDRHLVALHDGSDRVTVAEDTWEYLARAERAGAYTLGVSMPKGGHAMVRDAHTWQHITTSLVCGLLGLAPLPTALTDRDAPEGAPVTARQLLAQLGGAS
ncbi:alpha/beta fold hydrolase [Streptomyces sp. NBC_00690]|uniref:alpha/beta fold hydrolase n=1 Tax=Streptomyces sp. NBC_00690 TaxID=2975808 RepID=UPI002E2CC37E|nr:alpha/beta fold hydrolase [Streptomyces sp. NBC_00690]